MDCSSQLTSSSSLPFWEPATKLLSLTPTPLHLLLPKETVPYFCGPILNSWRRCVYIFLFFFKIFISFYFYLFIYFFVEHFINLNTCFFNISLYTVVLILLCSLTRDSVPTAEIMPNAITLLPPNLMMLLVHWGENCSFWTVSNKPFPLQPKRLNFDSSLKGIQSHCSSVYMSRVQ